MTVPLRKTWIPWGDAGHGETLAAMASMSRSRRSHSLVRLAWTDILGSVTPPSTYDEAMMLRQWLAQHFQFQRDPIGTGVFGGTEELELLRDPVILLQQINSTYLAIGDCDDAALLAATLALAAPVPFSGVHFRVVGMDAEAPYSHVYAEVLTAHGWVDMDVTRGQQVLPAIQKMGTYSV